MKKNNLEYKDKIISLIKIIFFESNIKYKQNNTILYLKERVR